MTTDTRETIMAAARPMVQAHGYNALSFREIAKAVGVKSASIHYHFPTKGDLGAALARRYTDDAAAAFEAISARTIDPAKRLRAYTDSFRLALQNDNRMCLCGIMAAEYDDLPDAVKAEVVRFGDVNVAWVAKVLSEAGVADAKSRALAIFAAIGGAQLAARSRGDITVYDGIVASYRDAGLIPA